MLAQVTFTQGPLSEAGIGLGTLQVWSEEIYSSNTSLTFLQYLKSVLGWGDFYQNCASKFCVSIRVHGFTGLSKLALWEFRRPMRFVSLVRCLLEQRSLGLDRLERGNLLQIDIVRQLLSSNSGLEFFLPPISHSSLRSSIWISYDHLGTYTRFSVACYECDKGVIEVHSKGKRLLTRNCQDENLEQNMYKSLKITSWLNWLYRRPKLFHFIMFSEI
jgi:hypothetical protein